MTPQRWQHIEDLFQSAVELPPEARAGFVEAACGGDGELLGELESLLAGDLEAQGFLESPASEMAGVLPEPGLAALYAQLGAGTQLGPHRIVAPLGAGGMGEVYSAIDTRLGRRVAIKLLPREMAEEEQALRRFQREARAASALNHPNICTVYDVGEYEGRPFLVMELLEGRSLKERLAAGPVPAGEWLTLSIRIAGALEAAHSQGIVHRDIKPANIFITSCGEPKVLDFGVAKLVSDPAQSHSPSPGAAIACSSEVTISLPGWTPGTVAYMSPEQARGEPIDARTDLFSFGVTMYQMVTGKLPFQGETPALLIEALLSREPAGPRRLNPAVPVKLERIILKVLQKERTARYGSAAELRSELEGLRAARPHMARWPLAVAGVLLLALIGTAIGDRRGWFGALEPEPAAMARKVSASSIQRVAVLPLRNLAGADREILTEGITDAIATDLARLSGLRVIAHSSALRYKDTRKAAPEIARALGADVVLGGSVLASGQHLELRLHLTRAASDAPFWSERFEGDFRASHGIRAEVARAVAREVRLRFSADDDVRLAKAAPGSRAVFDNYLRARHYWAKRTDGDIQTAVSYFKAAIEADPAYAPAYAGLADCYNQFATVAVGRVPGENRRLAIANAREAIRIDDRNAEAHAALGFAKLYSWDWAGAELELTRALDLNPSYASAHLWHASSLVIRRRFEEAFAEADRAGELDPLSPITQTQVGWIRSLAGRTEEAMAQFRKVLASNPDYPWAAWQLGGALSETGRHEEAIAILERAADLGKENFAMLGSLGAAYAMAGRAADAQRIVERLKRLSKERYVTPHAIGNICLGLGDLDCYFRSLEEGYRQRTNHMAYLSVVPLPRTHGAVRADPRFQDLLRRLGYDWE